MLATVWLTDRCNLNCAYCYEGAKGDSMMDKETADNATDYLIEHARNHNFEKMDVNYHGGEPLLNFELMQYFTNTLRNKCLKNNLGFGFMFTTNGTIFNKKIADFIKQERPCVTLSIDGDQTTHDSQRKLKNGKGSFEKAIKTSKHLQDLDILLFARMTFNSVTVNRLAANVEFLINQGFKTIKPVPDYGDKKWSPNDLEVFSIQLEKVKIIEQKYSIKVTLIDEYRQPFRRKKPCICGIDEINIAADGQFYPCSYVANDSSFVIGDLQTGIDKSKLDFQHKVSSSIDRSSCEGCGFYNYCNASRCTYINYWMAGALDKPSGFYCQAQHLLLKAAGKC